MRSAGTCIATADAVCNHPDCVRLAALFLNNMDQSADPCVNFHDFACGNYHKDNELLVSVKGGSKRVK